MSDVERAVLVRLMKVLTTNNLRILLRGIRTGDLHRIVQREVDRRVNRERAE